MPTLLLCEDEIANALALALPGRALRYEPSEPASSEEEACADYLVWLQRHRPSVIVADAVGKKAHA